jgi:hypothetical protein
MIEVTAKSTPVSDGVNHISAMISNLEGLISNLDVKLTAILNDQSNPAPSTDSPISSMSEHVHTLHSLANSIESCNIRLQRILEAIEL